MGLAFSLIVGGIIGFIYTIAYYRKMQKVQNIAEIFDAEIRSVEHCDVRETLKQINRGNQNPYALTLFIPKLGQTMVLSVKRNFKNVSATKLYRIQTVEGEAFGYYGAKSDDGFTYYLEPDVKNTPLWLAILLVTVCLGMIAVGVIMLVSVF